MSQRNNSLLFVIPALIWGSTWYAIKFQLGAVDPLVSVIYRFALAAIILISFCLLTRRSLKFTVKEHLRIALQGALLFGFNFLDPIPLLFFKTVKVFRGLLYLIF